MKNPRTVPASERARSDGAHRRSKIAVAVAAALYGVTAGRVPLALAADPAVGSDPAGPQVLQEVIVTATKREENLQSIPETIQALSASDIQNLGITHFEDIVRAMPTVSYESIGPTDQMFYIRGVSDGSSANASNISTTGFFLDDASTSYYGYIPDLHLYDIERIEVLDGPQGTLFGAGAMSGAIRVITQKPDAHAFSAGTDLDYGKIEHGGNDTTAQAFVNIPLISGSTALRLSGYVVHEGGYIDNRLATRDWVNGVVSTNAQWARNDYNTERQFGGRAAISQRLGDSWKAVLTVNYQRQNTAGSWTQDPDRYGLRQVAHFGPEGISDSFTDYNLNVEGDVGIGDLVFASTYWSYPYHFVTEYSEYVQYNPFPDYYQISPPLLQSLTCQTGPTIEGGTDSYGGCQAPNMYYTYDQWTQQWSNELRLQSKPGGRLHWLAGLYWQKTRQIWDTYYLLPGLQPDGEAYQSALSFYSYYYTGTAAPLPHEWYSSLNRNDSRNTAEFADVSFDLTKHWTIEAGLRYFNWDFSSSDQWAGYFWAPKTPSGLTDVSGHKLSGKASISYKPTSNVLLYGTFSQGYRQGGSNAGASSSCYQNGVPLTYEPDTLNNFEVGWKTGLLDGRMRWNGAFYYMRWDGYQAPIFDDSICPTTFNANFGKARIYGGETNVAYRITEGLTLQATANYNDSRLTSIQPNFSGVLTQMIVPNETLPFVPYFSYSANIRYDRSLGAQLRGFLEYDIAHKGDRWSDLRALANPALGSRSGSARVIEPEYNISDVRVGVQSPDGAWTLEGYVTNLWNTNAIILVNTGNYDRRETTNEPRVIGMHVSYNFNGK
ncbi:MAG TPA: TonB-dependent receptor [Steroidobacteraceae bacterium]|nr:TonB-dependent receptor [Steroidobacteraceae bacterium]